MVIVFAIILTKPKEKLRKPWCSIIEKIEKFGKTFDQLTKETVKAFLVDSKKSNFKI